MYLTLPNVNIKTLLTMILVLPCMVLLKAQISNPFIQLTSQSPTKTLLEKGRFISMPNPGVDLRRHNGNIDDTNTFNDYIYEHLELIRSCHPTIEPNYNTYHEFYNQVELILWNEDPPGVTAPSQISTFPQIDGIMSVTDWDYNTIDSSALDSGWVFMDSSDSLFKLRTSDYQIIDTIVTDSALFYNNFPRDPISYYIDTSNISIDSLQVLT